LILVDLNVVLDVVQRRQPHYAASAALLNEIVARRIDACIPAHAVTTLHYIVSKYQDKDRAATLVDWLLRYFEIAVAGKTEFRRARGLGMADFEDAVVASAAEAMGCCYVVTRNVRDFEQSPVPAVMPEEFMAMQPVEEKRP
jgi:predicted nucleic acid-binding protein